MKILFITPRVPYPPDDGGAICMFNTISGLAALGHEIHLLSVNTPKHYQEADVLSDIAQQYNVDLNTDVKLWKAIVNIFSRLPFNIERFISEKFSNKLIEILKGHSFDIIQFEGTYMAWYVDVARKYSSCPLVIRAHNIEHVIWERLSFNQKMPLRKMYFKLLSRRLKKFESEYYKKFDSIAAITSEDVQRFKDMGVKGKFRIIPAGVVLDKFKVLPQIRKQPFTLFILSALEWIPNQEGLLWFVNNVWSGVLKKMPQLELHVAGKGTPLHLFELKVPNMFIHGYVEDASVFMQQYDLMLVPLLSGGGMRLKIIEGMSIGKCIISSSIGAEGIECTNQKDILICNNPEDWINRIIDYFHEPEKFSMLGDNSQKLVREIYDNKIVSEKYMQLYKELLEKNV